MGFIERTEEILVKKLGSIAGKNFTIQKCKSCVIEIPDCTVQVLVSYCEDCKIFLGPVSGPVFLRNCNRVVLKSTVQQFRSRDCNDCTILLQIPGNPVIETSKGMLFGPFDAISECPGYANRLESSTLNISSNCWKNVYDFTPGRGRSKGNFRLLTEKEASAAAAAFPLNTASWD